MDVEKLEEIFEKINKSFSDKYRGKDCLFEGLKILKKYGPFEIEGAEHDIIYSCDIDKLVKTGITLEDAEELAKLGWFIEDNYHLAYFV